MIFRPELAKLILQGKKTQTRRPMKQATCRYQAGKSYALQPGRGKLAAGRITITEVRQEFLGDLSLKDAKREGFVTTDEFFDYWRGLYGSANPVLRVWVISFQLGDRTDVPRLLAPTAGGFRGDYTSLPYRAMRDAGEALSDAELEKYSGSAREFGDMLRRERAHRERMNRRAA